MRREAVGRGGSVEEAVRAAAALLGLAPEQVEVEVVDEGRAGLVWGWGARAAVVRVWSKASPEEEARFFVEKVVAALGVPAEVEVRRVGDVVEVSVEGERLGVLIGRGGETARALETLAGAVVRREGGGVRAVRVDVAGYRRRREDAVRRRALAAARRAVAEGRAVALEPMEAWERRVVHLALRGHPRVRTRSQGLEPRRRVWVEPTQGDEGKR